MMKYRYKELVNPPAKVCIYLVRTIVSLIMEIRYKIQHLEARALSLIGSSSAKLLGGALADFSWYFT